MDYITLDPKNAQQEQQEPETKAEGLEVKEEAKEEAEAKEDGALAD